jgi:hypothetical protein
MQQPTKRRDFDARMDKIMLPVMISLIIGLFITIIGMMIYQPLYIEGQITREQWLQVYQTLNYIMACSITAPIGIGIIAGIKLYIENLKFQSQQLSVETYDGPIIVNPYNIFRYQIQTLSGGRNDIGATKFMIYNIRRTYAYKTLLYHARTGNGIVDIDYSNIFKEIDNDMFLLDDDSHVDVSDLAFEERYADEEGNLYIEDDLINGQYKNISEEDLLEIKKILGEINALTPLNNFKTVVMKDIDTPIPITSREKSDPEMEFDITMFEIRLISDAEIEELRKV